jgi:hypothetical protein
MADEVWSLAIRRLHATATELERRATGLRRLALKIEMDAKQRIKPGIPNDRIIARAVRGLGLLD